LHNLIPIYKPYLPKNSLKYAHDALDSTWISSKGPYLERARNELAKFWNTDYIVFTNSGTAANHIMARIMRLKYEWRRNIICPNNVYVAAWNPFIEEDFQLWPKDADIESWNIDLTGYKPHRTHILLMVHNLGNIIDIPRLKKQYPDVPVIEDNCEGFLGAYQGMESGTASECFTVSFYGNKNVTSGEGGAFITYDKDAYEYASKFYGQGQSGLQYIHHMPGHNYRMTNVEAAILLGQLEYKDYIWEKKDDIFSYYRSNLEEEKLIPQYEEAYSTHSRWMFGIRLVGNRVYGDIKRFMDFNGIEVRPMFYPISYHRHLNYQNNSLVGRGTETVAKKLSKEVVLLPSYPEITREEQDYVIQKVREYAKSRHIL